MKEYCDKCHERLVEQGDFCYEVPIIIHDSPSGAYEDVLTLCEDCYDEWESEHRRATW